MVRDEIERPIVLRYEARDSEMFSSITNGPIRIANQGRLIETIELCVAARAAGGEGEVQEFWE
jgi:hypothetical protein